MKIRKKFNCKKSELLFAGLTIANSFKEHLHELSIVRSNWNISQAEDLTKRINNAISKYLGSTAKIELHETSVAVRKIQTAAQRDISFLKTIIEVDFANDKEKQKLILKKLGYEKLILRNVQKGDQEALAQLLQQIKGGLNNGILTTLTAKGTNPELLNRIIGYADNFIELNTNQEGLKGSTKILSQEGLNELNSIYDEIIGICKIAAKFYQYEPAKGEQFSFTKVVRNMNYIHQTVEEK